MWYWSKIGLFLWMSIPYIYPRVNDSSYHTACDQHCEPVAGLAPDIGQVFQDMEAIGEATIVWDDIKSSSIFPSKVDNKYKLVERKRKQFYCQYCHFEINKAFKENDYRFTNTSPWYYVLNSTGKIIFHS